MNGNKPCVLCKREKPVLTENRRKRRENRRAKWLILRPNQNGKVVASSSRLVLEDCFYTPPGVQQVAKGHYHLLTWNWGTLTPLDLKRTREC